MSQDEFIPLAIPREQSRRFDRNYIRIAVCEFRYPTLLDLEEKHPTKFQRTLRKDYPYYSKEQGVSLGDAGAAPLGPRYLFESKNRDWTINLGASTLSLETSRYTEFEDFEDRMVRLLESARELLDTDFFTRVGLRYINVIPIDDGDLAGWIRPELISTLTGGDLGTLTRYRAEVAGFLPTGRYTFRHGLASRHRGEGAATEYNLDFDYYTEGVDFDAARALVREFSEVNFSFFVWALGAKARATLGEGKPKREGKVAHV